MRTARSGHFLPGRVQKHDPEGLALTSRRERSLGGIKVGGGAQVFRFPVLAIAAIFRPGALLIAENLCPIVSAAAPSSATSSEQRGSAFLDSGAVLAGGRTGGSESFARCESQAWQKQALGNI